MLNLLQTFAQNPQMLQDPGSTGGVMPTDHPSQVLQNFGPPLASMPGYTGPQYGPIQMDTGKGGYDLGNGGVTPLLPSSPGNYTPSDQGYSPNQDLLNTLHQSMQDAANYRLQAAQLQPPQIPSMLMRPGQAGLAAGLSALLGALSGRFTGGDVAAQAMQGANQGFQQKQQQQYQNQVQQVQTQRNELDAKMANSLQEAQTAGQQLSAQQTAWLDKYKADMGYMGKQVPAQINADSRVKVAQIKAQSVADRLAQMGTDTELRLLGSANVSTASKRAIALKHGFSPEDADAFANASSVDMKNTALANRYDALTANDDAFRDARTALYKGQAQKTQVEAAWLPAEIQNDMTNAFRNSVSLQSARNNTADVQAQLSQIRATQAKGDLLHRYAESKRISLDRQQQSLVNQGLPVPDQLTRDLADATSTSTSLQTVLDELDNLGVNPYLAKQAKSQSSQPPVTQPFAQGPIKNPVANDLQAKAYDAIKQGRDARAVRAKYKQMTGQDLP